MRYIFNLCFVCDATKRTVQYEPLVKKLAHYLVNLELECAYLTHDETKAKIPELLAQVKQQINEKSACTLSVSMLINGIMPSFCKSDAIRISVNKLIIYTFLNRSLTANSFFYSLVVTSRTRTRTSHSSCSAVDHHSFKDRSRTSGPAASAGSRRAYNPDGRSIGAQFMGFNDAASEWPYAAWQQTAPGMASAARNSPASIAGFIARSLSMLRNCFSAFVSLAL